MSFFSVTFRDYDLNARVNETPIDPSTVILRYHACHLDANGTLTPRTSQIFAKRFPTSIQLPSPYKKITVEVQPEILRIWWNTETTTTPDFVYQRRKIERQYTDKLALPEFKNQLKCPDEPPVWTGRHGVGLYCELAQLGVKNYKITPIQP